MNTNNALKILKEDEEIIKLKKKFGIQHPNCFVAITAFHPDDPTKLLVIDYVRNKDEAKPRVDLKFPGGSCEDEDDSPFKTMIREARDEVTGGTPGALFEQVYPFYMFEKPSRNAGEIKHIKWCVLVKPNKLILPYVHNEGSQTDELDRSSNEQIRNHRYLDITNLAKELFFSHKAMLKKLSSIFAPHDEDYGWVFQSLG